MIWDHFIGVGEIFVSFLLLGLSFLVSPCFSLLFLVHVVVLIISVFCQCRQIGGMDGHNKGGALQIALEASKAQESNQMVSCTCLTFQIYIKCRTSLQ